MKQVLISDFDGTLTNGDIEKDFVKYLLTSQKLRFYQYFLAAISVPVNDVRRKMQRGNLLKAWRAGIGELRAQSWIEEYINDICTIALNQELCDRIRDFQGQKILLTGSSTELVAAYLRKRKQEELFDEIVGCEVRRFGYLIKSHPYGKDKVKFVKEMTGMRSGYGNEYVDRFFMQCCERAVAVNPDPDLKAYAQKEGWELMINR